MIRLESRQSLDRDVHALLLRHLVQERRQPLLGQLQSCLVRIAEIDGKRGAARDDVDDVGQHIQATHRGQRGAA